MKQLKKIRSGIELLFEDIMLLLTLLIPKNKKVLIFGAWWGKKYDDNSRALFEYVVRERPDLKAYWISPEKKIVDEVRMLGFPSLYSKSWKARFVAMIASVEFYCTSNTDIGKNLTKYLGGCVIVNLWHGVPLKKIGHDDLINQSAEEGMILRFQNIILGIAKKRWYVVCTSENFRNIYISAFRKDSKYILNLGQARNDYLFYDNSNIYRNRYLNKRIILYMPTHRQEGKRSMDMNSILNLPILNELCKKHNAILLIKKHFYHSLEKTTNEYEYIKDITKERPDSFALLSAADVLITDYSSCFIDYLLLNRPILFYCYDLEDYLENDRDMYFDYPSIVPGPICRKCEELTDELDAVLSRKDDYCDLRHEKMDFFYSKENQGLVSKRQIETILSLR